MQLTCFMQLLAVQEASASQRRADRVKTFNVLVWSSNFTTERDSQRSKVHAIMLHQTAGRRGSIPAALAPLDTNVTCILNVTKNPVSKPSEAQQSLPQDPASSICLHAPLAPAHSYSIGGVMPRPSEAQGQQHQDHFVQP